jgi:DNA primase large subunit
MSKAEKKTNEASHAETQTELRRSPMMAHLLDALEAGTDIGHYGRLTFVMVARHFLETDELVALLVNQPEMDEKAARMLIMQVQERDYNPPQRQKILDWQAQQEFPICPTPDDPNGCNVYRELQFPEGVYEHVEQFYEHRAEAEMKEG